MPESAWDKLTHLVNILHWLGKYEESKILMIIMKEHAVKLKDTRSSEELETLIEFGFIDKSKIGGK